MRIATSLISIDQAKHNLDLEIARTPPSTRSRQRRRSCGTTRMHVIEVEGASSDQLTTLYSNLYRLFLYPNSAYEHGHRGRTRVQARVQSSTTTPASSPTQTGAPIADGKVFVNNGFWDTYRTTWPAYSLFTPTQAGEM